MKNPFIPSDDIVRIQEWNSKFNFDFSWRKRYKIPFGSQQHRQMDFFDMKFDILEKKLLEYYSSEKNREANSLLRSDVISVNESEVIEDLFENLDLSFFDNIK